MFFKQTSISHVPFNPKCQNFKQLLHKDLNIRNTAAGWAAALTSILRQFRQTTTPDGFHYWLNLDKRRLWLALSDQLSNTQTQSVYYHIRKNTVGLSGTILSARHWGYKWSTKCSVNDTDTESTVHSGTLRNVRHSETTTNRCEVFRNENERVAFRSCSSVGMRHSGTTAYQGVEEP